ncbi:hypothetical protein GCM10007415_40120 [Parapedobacter pyrenivorans]|uniref:GPI inositol-deacylase PGAP1-like alpha/beta domain-containing protein n=1 Tax=Parapedobacter pyrenivorans TaxID=1305674 RepID=A0A917HZT3_9SPHI|nr:alpha/beta hydrolase family protein [Parapedobacter pyrenivorans]GGH00181.1 hypothetical protein GCM10007415_40120 [Parapedobacter pyrenivorans]
MDLPKFLKSNNDDTAVLFIHGLSGNYLTWKRFSIRLSEDWKEEDSFNLEYDEYYSLSFQIPILSFFIKCYVGKSIGDVASHLNSILISVGKKYQNVILVCHSMGGLVARKLIVDKLKAEKSLGNIKALITYATPHHGARLANWVSLFFHKPLALIRIKKFLQLNDLSRSSAFIMDLNADWSRLNVNDKIDFLRIVGLADGIVSVDSAEHEAGTNVFSFANKGHFSIIKPHRSITDGALMVTYNYLKDFKKNQESKELLEMGYEEESEYDY